MSHRLCSAALLPLLFSACAATPPAPEPTPSTPATPAAACNADAAQGHIGHTATAEMVDAARKDAGAAIARTLSPGQAVTMEYRHDRLNVHIDAGRKITRITCG